MNTTSSSEERNGLGTAAVYAILFGIAILVIIPLGILLRWRFGKVLALSLGSVVLVIITVTFSETVVKLFTRTIKDRETLCRILRVVGGLVAAALLIAITACGCGVAIISLFQ